MTINEYLKSKRKEQGLSLRAVGKKAGISHVYIKQVEDGDYTPGLDVALKWLWALEISVPEFLKIIGMPLDKKGKMVAVQGIEPCTDSH